MHTHPSILSATIRNKIYLLILFFSGCLAVLPAQADEQTETYSGIIVENAFIDVDRNKPVSQLRLKISNFSSADLTLLEIRSDTFERAVILLNTPSKGPVEVDTLSILQEETLALDSSHIRVELRNLNRAIRPNNRVEFELLFAGQTIRAMADVHPG